MVLPLLLWGFVLVVDAQNASEKVSQRIPELAQRYETQLVTWRRHIHQNPELSNRETATAAYIAETLRPLGLRIRTGIARTGVVAYLETGKPGPLVALRADMDALPVTEEVDLPFASQATATYNGEKVGVMHACGHDAHVAILLATAHVLSEVKSDLCGTVLFVFQPAEEGAPREEWPAGAEAMIREGIFQEQVPEAIFGLHVFSNVPTGVLAYRSGPFLAAVDEVRITLKGKQTHGSRPWDGVDPIVTASQVILGLQTVVSRQVNITDSPVVLTIGKIDGGVRNNIIPDSVTLWGTFRYFNAASRPDIHDRIRRTTDLIARSAGANARVEINTQYPVTDNHPGLTAWSQEVLKGVVGPQRMVSAPIQTGSEDFSFFQQVAPGFFFILGITPPEDLADGRTVPTNHSPLFTLDESALLTGVEAISTLAVRFLLENPSVN